jgi:hypothetical protein
MCILFLCMYKQIHIILKTNTFIFNNLSRVKSNEFHSWECHMFSRLGFVQRCIHNYVHLVFAHIFHIHANLCVHYKKQWISVCCCPFLQNSLSDGSSTVQTATAVQWNTISFRYNFLFSLCKTICVSTPINKIILSTVQIYNISWHLTNIEWIRPIWFSSNVALYVLHNLTFTTSLH